MDKVKDSVRVKLRGEVRVVDKAWDEDNVRVAGAVKVVAKVLEREVSDASCERVLDN
ncbi:MAG: hypothetical protein ACOX2M_00560 [Fastidiosipilaceae bacterium]